VPWGSFQQGIPSRGPGAQCTTAGCGPNAPGLNFWLGSNAMWGVYNASSMWGVYNASSDRSSLGPSGRAQRTHLGGLTIDVGDLFNGSATSFSAEQRIGTAQLATTHKSACGVFSTLTFMHPVLNILLVNCTWIPLCNQTVGRNVSVSVWTYRQMQGYNPHHGGLNPGQVTCVFKALTILTPNVHYTLYSCAIHRTLGMAPHSAHCQRIDIIYTLCTRYGPS
jgi:hypothetical protein